MRTKKKITYLLPFILAFSHACKDKYVSGAIVPSTGYLVIEGFINIGTGPTNISLTRTTSLDSTGVVPERHAVIAIISGSGTNFPLTEIQPGKYTRDQMPGDPSQVYHVHIKTSDGKEFDSDTSSVKITKPIDSVSWKANEENVQIFVSTHDDQNESIYYQWTFNETWEYSALYYHVYDYNPGDSSFYPISRQEDTLPHTCWMSDSSNTILITTTDQLNKDIVNRFPINTISYTESNRLIYRYSILVKQKTLSKDWYDWIQKIKKNTESLGSIFDAQPSQTGGNFHCTTIPDEPVIGWVGCATEQEMRIFITKGELPPVKIVSGYDNCFLKKVIHYPDSVKQYGYGYVADASFDSNGKSLFGFYAYPDCVDCRLYGGVSIQPSFW